MRPMRPPVKFLRTYATARVLSYNRSDDSVSRGRLAPADSPVIAKRPLRADAVRNRDHVLDVAGEVFASEGLGVPIDEIARRAGLGVGTLYRHFPTKEALFMAIVIRRMEQVSADARALEGAKDPGKAFFSFLSRLIDDVPVKMDLMRALAGTGFDPRRTEAKVESLRAVGALLVRAQRAGAVRADVQVGEVFSLVHAVHAAIGSHERDARSRARLIAIVFDGLRGSRASLSHPTRTHGASPSRASSFSRKNGARGG